MTTKNDEPKTPMISTGSMLNSSEGLISSGACAALVQQMTTSDDYRVKIAACLGLALVAAVYAFVRTKAKVEG